MADKTKTKQKAPDVSGASSFEAYVVELTEKSPDGKFSSYENQPGQGLDGHITLQTRGKPKKS